MTAMSAVSMAQLPTSRELQTWPRSRASPSFLPLGSSVLEASSSDKGLPRRQIRLQRILKVRQEEGKHRRAGQAQRQDAAEELDRHADEEDLDLRHQPGNQAEHGVEQQPQHDEWRRELEGNAEAAADKLGEHQR